MWPEVRTEAAFAEYATPLLVEHFSADRYYHEVAVSQRCADLVLVCGDQLISVEYKLSQWKHAALQACDHAIAADYSWVVMPSAPAPKAHQYGKTMRHQMRELNRGNGGVCRRIAPCNLAPIGFMFVGYDGSLDIVAEAAANDPIPAMRGWLLDTLADPRWTDGTWPNKPAEAVRCAS